MKRWVAQIIVPLSPCIAHCPCFAQECSYIEQLTPYKYRIKPGFVPNMRVPGVVYVNDRLKDLLFEELEVACQRGAHGGFLPAVKQIANVASLPGIVGVCSTHLLTTRSYFLFKSNVLHSTPHLPRSRFLPPSKRI